MAVKGNIEDGGKIFMAPDSATATGKNVEITVFPSGKTMRLVDIYYES